MDRIEIKWGTGFRYRAGPDSNPHMRGLAITVRKGGPQPNVALRVFPINSVGVSNTSYIEIPVEKVQEVADSLIQAAKPHTERSSILSVEELMDVYGPWGEHTLYDRESWRYEVVREDTQRGYWNWVEAKLEQEEPTDEAEGKDG